MRIFLSFQLKLWKKKKNEKIDATESCINRHFPAKRIEFHDFCMSRKNTHYAPVSFKATSSRKRFQKTHMRVHVEFCFVLSKHTTLECLRNVCTFYNAVWFINSFTDDDRLPQSSGLYQCHHWRQNVRYAFVYLFNLDDWWIWVLKMEHVLLRIGCVIL